MLRQNVKDSRKDHARKDDELCGQYKPVALPAVLAAASQRKPRNERPLLRDIPAVLKDIYA